MKKYYILPFILFLIFSLSIFYVSAVEFEDIYSLESEIKKDLADAIDNDVSDILEYIGVDEFTFENVYNISFDNIGKFFSNTLKEKIKISLKTFYELFCVVLLTGVVSALFIKDSQGNFISLLSVIALTVIAVKATSASLSAVVSVLQTSGKFMMSFVPIYTFIVSLSGNPASALTYNTLVIVFAEFISYILTSGLTDMLGAFYCLSISFTLNGNINISRMISAINKFVSITLGLTASLFSGFLSIKNILSVSLDGISVKSIRFLIGSLIPVVGSSISDAYSSLLGSINIIKGSVSVIGILVIIIINTPIIFETLTYYVMFSMLSYVADAVLATKAGDVLKCFACGIRILLLLCVFEMFILIISTGILLSVKNGG